MNKKIKLKKMKGRGGGTAGQGWRAEAAQGRGGARRHRRVGAARGGAACGNRGKDSFQKAPSYGPAGVLSLTSGESHCEVVEGLTGFMSQSTLRTCVPLQRVRKLQENHVLTYF